MEFFIRLPQIKKESKVQFWHFEEIFILYSNTTSLFPFAKKKPELFLRIISLAHAPMNVTDVSIGSINYYYVMIYLLINQKIL
jgi:hypothetical protein